MVGFVHGNRPIQARKAHFPFASEAAWAPGTPSALPNSPISIGLPRHAAPVRGRAERRRGWLVFVADYVPSLLLLVHSGRIVFADLGG